MLKYSKTTVRRRIKYFEPMFGLQNFFFLFLKIIHYFSRVFCCEFTLMFVSLASVPTIMIWLLLCWPKMEDNKVEEKPEQFMPWMEVTNEF